MSMFFLFSELTKNLSIEEARENLWQLKCMSFGVEVRFISYNKSDDNNNNISDTESHENSQKFFRRQQNMKATGRLLLLQT